MKKRILSLICALAMLFCMGAPAFAKTSPAQTVGTKAEYNRETTYGNLRIGIGTTTACVLGVTDAITDLVVPEDVEGYPVTVIAESAFQMDINLKTANLGSVTTVEAFAFLGCTNLESVTGESVTVAGIGSFNLCTSLSEASFPELTIIGDAAFRDCESLTVMSMPEAVFMGVEVFFGCTSLKKVVINQIESIGERAFAYDTKLKTINVGADNEYYASEGGMLTDAEETIVLAYPSASGDIVLDDSISEIASYAFQGARNAVTVEGAGIMSIGEGAFTGCGSLTGIEFSDASEIGEYAFANDTKLEDVDIPMIETIGEYAFFNTGIEVLEMCATDIGYGAFANCKKLQRVITDFVTEIGEGVFKDCEKLREVYFWDAAPEIDDKAFEGCADNLTFWYYRYSSGWSTPEWNGYPAFPFDTIPAFNPNPVETHTVTFIDGYNSSVISTVTVEDGDDVNFPDAPEHEGYAFLYWDNDGLNITADTTITAYYAIKTYTVTFMDGVYDTIIDTVTVNHGTDVMFPREPEHEGYTFTGWDHDGTNITADTTITALYTINSYTVTFIDGTDGTTIATQNINYGADVVTFPDVPEHEGYTFIGWDNDGRNITADRTITAQYDEIINETYTVMFIDGYDNTVISTATVEFGEDVTLPEAPEHEGYAFLYWDHDGKYITSDTTITAYYAIKTYTVTFMDGLDGTIIDTVTVNHGTDVMFPREPEHVGYTFTGWDHDGVNITSDTTITALYTINSYTVTFIDGTDGTTIAIQTINHGEDVLEFPDAPVHEGYTFTGWDKDGKNITEDVTITALYEEVPAVTHTVTFVDGVTNNVIGTATVEHGADVTLPNAPVHEGYTFKGWDKDGKNITADTTITAQYERIKVLVTFMDGVTNKVIKSDTVEYGSDVTFPEAPVHEGYTFKGWDKDGKNITSDTTITAQYEKIKVLVTFMDGVTGKVIKSVSVDYGTDVEFPEAPAHEGYTFKGWDKDGKNITSDTIITALYEKIEEPPVEILTGDLNGDGKVNTADAVIVLKYAAEMITLDENQTVAGDCNHDGKVNTADAVLILKFAAGMITEF